MVSFTQIDLAGKKCEHEFLDVFANPDCRFRRVKRFCERRFQQPHVFSLHVLSLRFTNADEFKYEGTGFKMLFSFHDAGSRPQRLGDGTWNCSVSHWSQFRQHLPCDLEPQCHSGEDEAECPYTTQRCGPGRIQVSGQDTGERAGYR